MERVDLNDESLFDDNDDFYNQIGNDQNNNVDNFQDDDDDSQNHLQFPQAETSASSRKQEESKQLQTNTNTSTSNKQNFCEGESPRSSSGTHDGFFSHVDVKGPKWVTEGAIYAGHYEYAIECLPRGDTEIVTVYRRYNHLYSFHEALACTWPGLFVPQVPPKEALSFLQQEDSESIQIRKQGIKRFLEQVAYHKVMGQSEQVQRFFTARSTHEFNQIMEQFQEIVKERKYAITAPARVAEDPHQSAASSGSQQAVSTSSLPTQAIFSVVSVAKGAVTHAIWGNETHQRKEAYGVFLPEAEKELSDFNSFEDYLRTLNELYNQLADQVNGYLKSQDNLANNYDKLSESFSSLKRIKQENTEIVDLISHTFMKLQVVHKEKGINAMKGVNTNVKQNQNSILAGMEALSRRRAIIHTKYSMLNTIQKLKQDVSSGNTNNQNQAQTEVQIETLSQKQVRVSDLLIHVNQQVKQEVHWFRQTKSKETEMLIRRFTNAQKMIAESMHQEWDNCIQSDVFTDVHQRYNQPNQLDFSITK